MATDHRKRRRRRREDREPLAAFLNVSDHLSGPEGVITIDLFEKLSGNHLNSREESSILHVAVTPNLLSLTSTSLETSQWRLLSVRCPSAQQSGTLEGATENTLYLPRPLAEACLSQANVFREKSSTRINVERFKIGIVEVQPIVLEAVYIEVNGAALEKHYEVQKQFSGGFPDGRASLSRTNTSQRVKKLGPGSTSNTDDLASTRTNDLLSLVSKACRDAGFVRQHDNISLPLPTHPITHASFPPAKITLCEPVKQGVLGELTRVIINRSLSNSSSQAMGTHHAIPPAVNGSKSDSASSSDESLGETISLSLPSIATDQGGPRSAKTATPRGPGTFANGAMSPGSVISTMTTGTTGGRLGDGVSLVVKVKPLQERVPDQFLHPVPAAEEDDEARLFVDMRTLLKLGCFSGDWVSVQPQPSVEETLSKGLASEIGDRSRRLSSARPMKIYGIADLVAPKPQASTKEGMRARRPSNLTRKDNFGKPVPFAWMSPVSLHNFGQSNLLQISTLSAPLASPKSPRTRGKESKQMTPPVAKEVTLIRIASPTSTDRALQIGIFSALKSYFEYKRRILMEGDILALALDATTSRVLAASSSSEGADNEANLGQVIESLSDINRSKSTVAFFKVGKIEHDDEDDEVLETDIWSGAATMEPMRTRLKQVGSEQSKVLSTIENSWQHYLGLRKSSHSNLPADIALRYTLPSPKRVTSLLLRRLRELFSAAVSLQALHFGLQPVFICLHSSQRAIGKATIATRAAHDLGLHSFELDAYDIITEGSTGGDAKSEAFLEARLERALSCGPTCTSVVIRHIELLSADRIITALRKMSQETRILVATTTAIDKVSADLRSLFTHEIEISAPDEGEREGLLRDMIESQGLELAHDVELSSIAVKTAALVAGNLLDITERAFAEQQSRIQRLLSKANKSEADQSLLLRDLVVAGGESIRCITKVDFDVAVEAARKTFADAIGAPKIPNVSWDDVGGLGYVKYAVMETIQLPLERPELFASGMKKRSGILFYGPPGTGKTLLAKAIATEFSLNFFSVKGPELLNMYIGESEANVRRVFQRARDAKPCVVFFDELDSVAPKRGNQGDSGGVMDRIVSQMLAELDGMSDGKDGGGGGVFVIGATNRPDLLDPALLRPGRFDKMLYLGISDTHEKQLTILEALTRKFVLEPGTSLAKVANGLPFTYTGADLYALCSDAMLKAITRRTAAIERKIKSQPSGPVTPAYFFDNLAQTEDITVTVGRDDFYEAQRELVGSVSAKELAHYQQVRQSFEGAPSDRSSGPGTLPMETSISSTLNPNHDTDITSTTAVAGLRPKRPHPNGTLKPRRHTSERFLSPSMSTSGKNPTGPKGTQLNQDDNNSKVRDKGKGKAVSSWTSDEDDDDDDAYVTSNSYPDTPEEGSIVGDYGDYRRRGGNGVDKGGGFGDDGQDEGMYD